AIDGDMLRADVGDRHQHRSLLGARLELHARHHFDIGGKGIARHLLDQLRVARAIALFGRHIGGERFAQAFAIQRLLQARHDIAGAVQIAQRRVRRGAVQHLAGVVGKSVVNGRNATLADFHWKPP
ncbi:hypothetical protein XGA_4229, partial [Xanthomonas hortorum ATCC 19865]